MKWLTIKTYPKWLLAAYLAALALMSINPANRESFLIENVLSFIVIIVVVMTYRNFRLSNLSYTLLFIFLSLNLIGFYYTHAGVPYEKWSKSVLGISINEIFGFQRNNYDRLTHFTFGLLLSYPIREVFLRIADAKGFWGYYLPLDVVISFSALYELIEYAIALAFGPSVGALILGTQGDVWDTHKDIAMATSGAVISMFSVALINYMHKPRFARDIAKSLEVKRKTPLGEYAWRRMMALKRMREKMVMKVKSLRKKPVKLQQTKKAR